jgi:integrase
MRPTPRRLRASATAPSWLLIWSGLRRAELVGLEFGRIQQRESRWVIPDLVGKVNRLRPQVPV